MSHDNPGWVFGQQPTVAQWNAEFGSKQDWNQLLDDVINNGGAPPQVGPIAWTPVDDSGADLVFASAAGLSTTIGKMAFAQCTVEYPMTADATMASVGGLVAQCEGSAFSVCPTPVLGGTFAILAAILPHTTRVRLLKASDSSALTNADLSELTLIFQMVYPTA